MTKQHPAIEIQLTAHEFCSKDFALLSYQILTLANTPILRIDFLREITQMIFDFSGCDQVELHVKEGEGLIRFLSAWRNKNEFHFEIESYRREFILKEKMNHFFSADLKQIGWDVIQGYQNSSYSCFTPSGSFWFSQTNTNGKIEKSVYRRLDQLKQSSQLQSVAIIPLIIGNERIGYLQLQSLQENIFTLRHIEAYEELCHILGFAVAHRKTNIMLRERVKELSCLYQIVHLAVQPGKSLEELMQTIVTLLPPAWLYPEIATARIVIDAQSYYAQNWREGKDKQTSDIIVHGTRRGFIEVVYLEKKSILDEGPFLIEERKLIDTIANEVSLIILRRQAEEEDKSKLQDQIRHADRLATIGLLAAGVAHEINEPLGSILGYAQLAEKNPALPNQVRQDIEKIVSSTLHAREVMKKLMLFARQMPPKKMNVNLNDIVKEGLYFLEARCSNAGIELLNHLTTPLHEMTADPTQLYQVLVNLVVNAIQAMPLGGKLLVETKSEENYISLVVEDTGIGMSEETIKKIFIPFFTTKDIGEGTGLGLSVVHGIVTSHGGTISVKSKPGHGARFEVKLPISSLRKSDLNIQYDTSKS